MRFFKLFLHIPEKKGIISTRHVCEQIVWQNERREGACSFRVIRVTTFGGSKPPPYGKTRYGATASKTLFLLHGIISTRYICEQIIRQNGRKEGVCPFRIKFFTSFGGSKPPPYDKPDAAQLRALCLLNHNSVSAEPLACDVVSHFISLLPFGLAGDGFVNFTMH